MSQAHGCLITITFMRVPPESLHYLVAKVVDDLNGYPSKRRFVKGRDVSLLRVAQGLLSTSFNTALHMPISKMQPLFYLPEKGRKSTQTGYFAVLFATGPPVLQG